MCFEKKAVVTETSVNCKHPSHSVLCCSLDVSNRCPLTWSLVLTKICRKSSCSVCNNPRGLMIFKLQQIWWNEFSIPLIHIRKQTAPCHLNARSSPWRIFWKRPLQLFVILSSCFDNLFEIVWLMRNFTFFTISSNKTDHTNRRVNCYHHFLLERL